VSRHALLALLLCQVAVALTMFHAGDTKQGGFWSCVAGSTACLIWL